MISGLPKLMAIARLGALFNETFASFLEARCALTKHPHHDT
jgi:hypothetical protein